MDDAIIKKLSRQVRVLNFFLILFSVIFLAVLAVVGLAAYGAKQEVDKAQETLSGLREDAADNLTLRDELCDVSGTLGTLIRSQSDICAQ